MNCGKFRSTTSVVVIISMVFLPALSNITPAAAKQMEYFPLSCGSYLHYNSTDDNGSWLTKRYIEDDYEFVGGIFGTFCVFWCEAALYDGDSEYSWVNQMWLSRSGDTLYWWGFEDEFAKIVVNSGLKYVKEPASVGDKQSGSTSGTLILKSSSTSIPNTPFSANYTIDTIESVSTPAGTFSNCIKVHEQETTPDGNVDFYVWYAPNVGAVKYNYPQRDNRIDVLTDYYIEPNNEPWENWVIPYVPQILTWTIVAGIAVVALIIAFTLIKKKKMKK